VEPVYGIYSKHPLSDPTVYDDDILEHGTDAKACSYYRRFDSLGAGITSHNVSECGEAYLGYPCVYNIYGFGWAITGVADTRPGLPLSLAVDRDDEPDTRSGQKPVLMQGTITITGLTPGGKYNVYRWNSVATAFDYSLVQPQHTFTAQNTSYVFHDTQGILSSSATYYRCLAATPQ